jgi:hypothetical protein
MGAVGVFSDILPIYVKIHSGLSDINAIKAAYKAIGMAEAAKGNVDAALRYFNQWQYAYASHLHLDQYSYDFDILACIRRMASSWRFKEHGREASLTGKKFVLHIWFLVCCI